MMLLLSFIIYNYNIKLLSFDDIAYITQLNLNST